MDAAEFTCQHLPPRRPPLRIAVVTETYPPEVNGVAMTIGHLVGGLQARNHSAAAATAARLSWETIVDRFEQVLMRLANCPPVTSDPAPRWASATRMG